MKTYSPKSKVVTSTQKRSHFTIKVEWGRFWVVGMEG